MTDEMKEIINSNEKHIAVVARAGCVDKDTEYYNGNTWVKISNYTGGKVLQYEKDGSVSLVEPLKYIKEENDIFYKLNNQVLTKEHRVVTDKGIKQLIDLLLENKSINIPVTFKIKNEKIEHSVLDIVCCLLGNYNNDVCTIKTTLNNKFLEELLSNTQYGKFNSNFKSIYTFKHKSKIKTLNLDLLKTIDLDKTFYYLTNIIESKPYITKDRNKGEIFQLIGSSVGFKSILDQQGNTYIVKYENSKFDYIERLYDNVKIIKNQDYKYCFTVPSGMLVLRREGKIFVTGNSGKTFTMLNYVKAKPNEKILFLVYNKEMSLDFSRKIKEDKSITNVHVSTIHSIAYRWYIKKYGKRSFKNISVVDIKQIINKKLDYGDLSLIKFYYNMFLASDVSTVYDLNPVKDSDVRLFKYVDDVFNFYKHNNTIQHNVYLKLFQLSGGKIDGYDTILADECNDHNMCMLSILKNNMDKKIIMVGDPLQNLNAFNYTVDGLTYMIDNCGFKKYTLSMSFRISDNIAEIASKFLSYMYDTKIRFYGCKDTIIKKIDLNKANKDTFQVHLLCRNKLGGLNEILELFQKNKNKKIYYVGGLEGFGLNEIENLLNYNGNIYLGGKKFHISELRKLKKDAIETDSIIDTEISKAISLYDFGMKHREELILLRYNEVTKREDADIIVQTAHSSKGGTFKNVYLAKDFNPIEDIKKELNIFKDNEYMYNVLKSEINLLYVAMTRPTDTLYLNEALNKKDKQKDRFLVDDKIIKKDIDK